MRKIIVTEFITLDGVIEDPGGSEEHPESGWNLSYMNEEAEQYKLEELKAADTQLLGAVTYRGFAATWPTINAGAFSDLMNGMKKYVVSSTMKPEELTWNNSRQIKENVVEEITKLKEEPGKDILVAGSSVLVQTLIKNDLVDEYHLQLHPIILGTGRRLFKEGLDRKDLNLKEVKALSNGLLLLTYSSK
jgi:dihydrofolate reductase